MRVRYLRKHRLYAEELGLEKSRGCHHIKQKHFRDLRNEDPFPLNLYLSHDPLILATNSHRPYQVVLEKLCLGQ